MRAAIFNGPKDITVGERPDPTIQDPTDAVVRVVLACVCGSDLRYFRGESDHPVGSIGHEFIGIVEDIGPDVTRHRARRPRDRAVHLQRPLVPALPQQLHHLLPLGRELRRRHHRRRPGRSGAGPPCPLHDRHRGCPHGAVPFAPTFFRNIAWRGGPAPSRLYIPDLLDDVLAGTINPGIVLDYETDLDGTPDAYAAMDDRRAVKSLICVGSL
jgi:threonine dehydrogenase-like Zn-dependent dehydrogenase